MTSSGSVREYTQTLPSIEDVAICIELEGIFGTGSCWRLLGEEAFLEGREGELCCSEVLRLLPSCRAVVGKGGGKGETEMLVTDAPWA